MNKMLKSLLAVMTSLMLIAAPINSYAQTATAKPRTILTDYDLDATSGGGGIYACDAAIGVSGTGASACWFDVSKYEKFTISIQVAQLNVTGGIESRIVCRSAGAALGQQVKPVLADGTVTPSFVTVSAVGGWFHSESGTFNSCRVQLQINSADDGSDVAAAAEKVNIYINGR